MCRCDKQEANCPTNIHHLENVRSRQIDKGTVYYKTWKYWAGGIVKNVETSQLKAKKYGMETPKWTLRENSDAFTLVRTDDLDGEEIMNSAKFFVR